METITINVKTFEYQKVEKENTPFELPAETIYLFETGVRRNIRIVPAFFEFDHEIKGEDMVSTPKETPELYRLEVTCVYGHWGENKIEKFDISVHSIPEIFGDEKNKSNAKSILELLFYKSANVDKKERFDQAFEFVLNNLRKTWESELTHNPSK